MEEVKNMSGINSEAVVAGVTTAVNDTLGLITDLLPLALTVFAAMWGIKKGIQFFKKASN